MNFLLKNNIFKMDSLPSVPTVKKILENLTFSKKKLTKKEIEKLLNLQIGDESMLTLKNRTFILEVSGMISKLGFSEAYTYLKTSQKETNRNTIIKNSPLFEEARKRNFLDITKDSREGRIESPYTCPKCKSKQVDTVTAQTRSADEGATTIHKCRNCGNYWYD